MVRVKIYLCKYVEVEQVVSRHYVSSYSTCNFLKETDLNELSRILSDKDLKKLVEEHELLLVDENIIRKIINRKTGENIYLTLVISGN